jgi:hypothetical protein
MTNCVHQLVICLLLHFIHIWYIGWSCSDHVHIIPISQMVDFYESYSPFHVCLTTVTRCANAHMIKQTWKGLELLQISTIHEIGIICTCSDHGQSRYQIWIKCDNTQMTSCIHKMWERTARSMCILYRFHRWLIFTRVIALFMFVWPYVRLHILCTQLVICLLSLKCDKKQMTSCIHKTSERT